MTGPQGRGPVAYHLVPEGAWMDALKGEAFRPASLQTDGFVHLTHALDDLVEVANAFYRDEPGAHVVLAIDLDRLESAWRYDGDERFPHVYGPLDRTAISAVHGIARDADGRYLPLDPDRGKSRMRGRGPG